MQLVPQQQPTTEAVITVSEVAPGSPAAAVYPPGSTPPTLVNTVGFSYSSDMLALGDPFSVSVPNPRGQYTGKFLRDVLAT